MNNFKLISILAIGLISIDYNKIGAMESQDRNESSPSPINTVNQNNNINQNINNNMVNNYNNNKLNNINNNIVNKYNNKLNNVNNNMINNYNNKLNIINNNMANNYNNKLNNVNNNIVNNYNNNKLNNINNNIVNNYNNNKLNNINNNIVNNYNNNKLNNINNNIANNYGIYNRHINNISNSIQNNNLNNQNINSNKINITSNEITSFFENIKKYGNAAIFYIREQLDSNDLLEKTNKNNIIFVITGIVQDRIQGNLSHFNALKNKERQILYSSIVYYLNNIGTHPYISMYDFVKSCLSQKLKTEEIEEFDEEFKKVTDNLNRCQLYNILNKIIKDVNILSDTTSKNEVKDFFENIKKSEDTAIESIKDQLNYIWSNKENKNDIIDIIIYMIKDSIHGNFDNYSKLKNQDMQILYLSIFYYLCNIETYSDISRNYFLQQQLRASLKIEEFNKAIKNLNNYQIHNTLNNIIKNVNSLNNIKTSKNEVKDFFENVEQDRNIVIENIRMQLKSLLLNKFNIGEDTIDSESNNIIDCIINLIKDHANNNNNFYKVIKNKKDNKTMQILYILLEYYLQQVDLCKTNYLKFWQNSIDYLQKQFKHFDIQNNQYFNNAVNIIQKYQLHYVLNKIIQGINLLSEVKNNISSISQIHLSKDNTSSISPINLSNSNGKCFLVSAVQLFIGMINQSDPNSNIRKTSFAKFVEYMETKSKINKNNKKINFIQTLKKFVNIDSNKDLFNTKSQQQALSSLFRYEKGDSNGTAGLLGSIFILRIFPELQNFISGNLFCNKDLLLNCANKFVFDNNKKELHDNFNDDNSVHALKDAIIYQHRIPFNNREYIISSLHGKDIKTVVKDQQYISFYDNDGSLNIYKLIGMQLRTEIRDKKDEIGHYISYVKQNKNDNSWSYIDSLNEKTNDNNHELRDILEIINSKNYIVHQAVYEKVI